jgi:hypothetical protein
MSAERVFATLLGLLSLTAVKADAADWETYTNTDWGYSIDLPANLFGPPVEVKDRGGVEFTSVGGEARLFVFAGQNPGLGGPSEIADYLSLLDDVHRVTYRRVTSKWVVISGFIGKGGEAPGNIFYERLALSPNNRTMSGFRLEYPPAQRSVYDHLLGRIGRSLTPPQRG